MENISDLKAIRFIQGTKVSHDYDGHNVNTFSYRDLVSRNIPSIGIPCRQNGLVVIDVDVEGESHKEDGREFWKNFCEENGIPQTYTVGSANGGFHFYFRLPAGLNLDTFRPPGKLAPGVDVKYNGWVGAPPTPGYKVLAGNITTIAEAPPSLLAYMSTVGERGAATFDNSQGNMAFYGHKPFTEHQLHEIRTKIKWLQQNAELDRSEWRDGLFALKAGIDDPEVLYELADQWTMNKAYEQGDEDEARAIVDKADKYGPIGPGTIFTILNMAMRREGATALQCRYAPDEILTRAKVKFHFDKNGVIKLETSESNASALVGAMFDEDELYHDIRSDQYMFKGKPYSDVELLNTVLPFLQNTHGGLGLEKFRKGSVQTGLEVLMSARQIDPHQRYLEGLVWDGVPRIEQFFQSYIGVDDTPYHRKVSKNFWVALAARGLRPGCKFDSVVILEGAEGIRKSSLVEAIGGEYTFAPTRRDIMESTDELRKMHQSIIVELPELMGLVNESPEKVKAFLASSYDNIRALYARRAVKQPRSFIFVGTTNSKKYLTANMGLRRFWPITIPSHVTKVDIDGIKRDRDLLFAEAIAHMKDGYEYYYMPNEYLSSQAGNKIITDPLLEPIEEIVRELNEIEAVNIYRSLEASGMISRGYTPKTKSRIETTLTKLGFDNYDQGRWRRLEPIQQSNTFYGFNLNNIV